MALPQKDFKAKWKASLLDAAKHWTVENGELVNDGKGLLFFPLSRITRISN